MAVRATHVDERLEAAEVVSARDRGVLGTGDARHRVGEHAIEVRVLAQIGEERLAVRVLEADFSRAHSVQELLPAAPVVAVDHHAREVAQRSRDVAAQRRRGGR
jgi:hypothetical protein